MMLSGDKAHSQRQLCSYASSPHRLSLFFIYCFRTQNPNISEYSWINLICRTLQRHLITNSIKFSIFFLSLRLHVRDARAVDPTALIIPRHTYQEASTRLYMRARTHTHRCLSQARSHFLSHGSTSWRAIHILWCAEYETQGLFLKVSWIKTELPYALLCGRLCSIKKKIPSPCCLLQQAAPAFMGSSLCHPLSCTGATAAPIHTLWRLFWFSSKSGNVM